MCFGDIIVPSCNFTLPADIAPDLRLQSTPLQLAYPTQFHSQSLSGSTPSVPLFFYSPLIFTNRSSTTLFSSFAYTSILLSVQSNSFLCSKLRQPKLPLPTLNSADFSCCYQNPRFETSNTKVVFLGKLTFFANPYPYSRSAIRPNAQANNISDHQLHGSTCVSQL